MTIGPAVWFSLGRAAVVTALALPPAAALAGRLRGGGGAAWWALVLLPLLTPELLTGYGWSNFALSLANRPWANEALTAALIWGRCVCAAAALLAVAPGPRRTRSAVFLRGLLLAPVKPRDGSPSALGAYMRERVSRGLERFGPAGGITALFAFGQFEVPSLAGTTAWTVALFDAHAALPELTDSLRLAAPAAAVQLAALLPALAYLRRPAAGGVRDERDEPDSRVGRIAGPVCLAAAVSLSVAVPAAVVAREAGVAGWRDLAGSEWRLSQFAVEAGRGLACGAAGAALAGGLLWVGRRLGVVTLAALMLPGLCGPLVVALAAEWAATRAVAAGWPGAAAVRDSVLPLVVALGLFLLPRAAVLGAAAEGRTAAVQLARLLARGTPAQRRAAGRVRWRLSGRGAWVRWGLLSLWGAADVGAAAILLPPGVNTAPPGLYNLMHYGHNAVLGAECLLLTLLPAIVLAAGAWAGRFVFALPGARR